MKTNLNDKVRVKLTDLGKKLHHESHRNHYDKFINCLSFKIPEYVEPATDADGWSEWTLWELMREFGRHLYNGCQLPFETEIEILGRQI